jgi:selenocysteine lyase/cysteine desulfurase
MGIARRTFMKLLGRGSVGMGTLPLWGRRAAHGAWPPPAGVDDAAFWKMVRDQFPLTHARAYFNTGGLGPAPYPVLGAVERVVAELQAVSETGHHYIEEARAPVAAFLGVRPTEVAFTRNATEANSTVASGLKMQAGDEVIFESHAHPGGSIPWMNRQKQHGIKVKIFEPDPTSVAGNLERIEALITPRTRVIQLSHVTAPTGIRFPVEEIARLARDRGLWFHIDGAQSAGMFPFDLKAIGCDSYATSCHKWMCAPHGTGVLYVCEERLDEVAPTDVGAYSDDGYELPDVLTYHPTARRYECGTHDASRVVGIVAAIDFLQTIGLQRIADYGQGLARYLQARLRELPGVTVLTPEEPTLSGSMTTFKTDTVPYDQLNARFTQDHQLRCRIVTERGLDALRVSTHLFNSKEECDRVVEATREVLAKG